MSSRYLRKISATETTIVVVRITGATEPTMAIEILATETTIVVEITGDIAGTVAAVAMTAAEVAEVTVAKKVRVI